MEDFLNSVWAFFDPVLEVFRNGFDLTNRWLGLVVALIAAFVMSRWAQLIVVTLIAALAYSLVEHFWPILTRGGEWRLPTVTEPLFWQRYIAYAAGLLIIIAMFFAVKKVFLSKRAEPAKAKH